MNIHTYTDIGGLLILQLLSDDLLFGTTKPSHNGNEQNNNVKHLFPKKMLLNVLNTES